MYSIVIRPEVQHEIQDAAAYYEDQQSGLAQKFLGHLKSKISFIQLFPLAAPVRFDDFRAVFLGKYPYLLIYEVLEDRKEIVVVRLFHTSKNPPQ